MKKINGLTISYISIAINLVLFVAKLIVGILGNSNALVSDGFHSLSDVLSSIIVIVALVIARKQADAKHPYGHEKFESLLTLVIVIILMYTAFRMGETSVVSIVNGTYLQRTIPSVFTIIIAVFSICVKEGMYRCTIRIAKREKSDALKADAWHHRSDSFSSIGSLAGIIFARIGVPIADDIASILICLFIVKTALEIMFSAVNKLTDSACDAETEEKLRNLVSSYEAVKRVDMLKTRRFGNGYYVDLEISLDENLLLKDAHMISENIHDDIERAFPEVKHCMIHVNSAK